MEIAFYIASVIGAIAVYLMMPASGPKPKKLGALLGLATGGGLFAYLLSQTPADVRPDLYFYVFALLAVGSALRVITHPRPVYSALYFVMVVLASSGLFLVLEAEFMAFAMIIIYAGAILVTYLFVIMLATLPQAEGEEEQAPEYDRVAREPLGAVAVGFALLAVLCHVIFSGGLNGQTPKEVVKTNPASPPIVFAVETVPGRIIDTLVERELLTAEAAADGAGLKMRVEGEGESAIIKATWGESGAALIALTPELKETLEGKIGNIDRVGSALFEGHTLGIELAGIILLLSMVGAVVIGRKTVYTEPESREPDLEYMHKDEPLSDVSVGEQPAG